MSYYFKKELDHDFETAVAKVTAALAAEGFGIVTEMNVHSIFKNKLNKDFRKYKILGACSPADAFNAIAIDDKIGTLLPCNVILQEFESGKVEVAAVDPLSYMENIKNNEMETILLEIRDRIKKAIDTL
jgi:uncharacterized protein (DUF302 family)